MRLVIWYFCNIRAIDQEAKDKIDQQKTSAFGVSGWCTTSEDVQDIGEAKAAPFATSMPTSYGPINTDSPQQNPWSEYIHT